jgi:hypothetical protein
MRRATIQSENEHRDTLAKLAGEDKRNAAVPRMGALVFRLVKVLSIRVAPSGVISPKFLIEHPLIVHKSLKPPRPEGRGFGIS